MNTNTKDAKKAKKREFEISVEGYFSAGAYEIREYKALSLTAEGAARSAARQASKDRLIRGTGRIGVLGTDILDPYYPECIFQVWQCAHSRTWQWAKAVDLT